MAYGRGALGFGEKTRLRRIPRSNKKGDAVEQASGEGARGLLHFPPHRREDIESLDNLAAALSQGLLTNKE
jgi:hypothetical protein